MTQEMWYSDTEVFAKDWLFVAKRQSDGRTVAVWNDNDAVQDFIDAYSPVLCGYNYRDYDSHILKAILLGWCPEDIKDVNDTIINSDDRSAVWALFNGQPRIDLPPVIDLFHDVVPRKGLKEIEANIGMDIVESSVPFTIDRALTDDERDEVQRYCLHDVEATEALYGLRFDYVKAKSDLCEMRDIDPLTMLRHTNARIVAEVLGAVPTPPDPDERYDIPANVDRSAIPSEVIAFAESIDFSNCTDNLPPVEFTFHGVPTVVGLGGIHAAIPKYAETASDTRVILLQDVGSYYPSLIINNGYMSRAVGDASAYEQFYRMRMDAKAAGDKARADAAKLVLNTTYGTMKDSYNRMYDPMQATRVCLSGQIYLLDLIEQMFRRVPEGLQLIQLNTDGWMLSCPTKAQAEVQAAVDEWCARTGFTVDTAFIEKIVQANVNNYVMRTVEGKVKAKGGVVARRAGGDFKSNSLTIIDAAVSAYLLDGVPVEETVAACDDLTRFQIVAKAGRSYDRVVHVYDGEEREVQRVNRVYATTDKKAGGIFKVKEGGNPEKIPLTPPHCHIDNEGKGLTTLDRSWYVALAKRKATEFVTRDKKEREQMAQSNEEHNELAQEEKPKPTRKRAEKADNAQVPEPVIPSFGVRLLTLQAKMATVASAVKFDGVVENISYEYADTQQYKAMLAHFATECGIIFKFEVQTSEPTLIMENGKSKSFAVNCDALITLRDAYSDEYETYTASGIGVNVQPGYCVGGAQTNALRNFILNNFLLDNKGRDGDDQLLNSGDTPATAKSGGYVNASQKAEIKQGIADAKADDAQYATDLFATALYDKIVEARKVPGNETKFSKIVKEHFNEDGTPIVGENGKSTMLKTLAVATLTKAEEIVAEAGN